MFGQSELQRQFDQYHPPGAAGRGAGATSVSWGCKGLGSEGLRPVSFTLRPQDLPLSRLPRNPAMGFVITASRSRSCVLEEGVQDAGSA